MAEPIEITCPCCDTILTVDGATGDVLAEQRPETDPNKTFDSALSEVQGGARRRSDAFEKAFDRTKRLDDVLSKKFEEARKKAAKDKSKPHNPFDME